MKNELFNLSKGVASAGFTTNRSVGASMKDDEQDGLDSGGRDTKFPGGRPMLASDEERPELAEARASSADFKELLEKNADKLLKKGVDIKSMKELGAGSYGVAYDIGSNKVFKITGDDTEARASYSLMNKAYPNIVNVFDVFSFKDSDKYGLILDKLTPLSDSEKTEFKDGMEMIDAAVEERRVIVKISGTEWEDWEEWVRDQAFGNDMEDVAEDGLDILKKFNVNDMANDLFSARIGFLDYHTGNVMKRGSQYVITDLGVSKPASSRQPPVLEKKKKLKEEATPDIDPSELSDTPEEDGYNEDGFKLEDRMEFQDLKVAIEQAKGSKREWEDEEGNTGVTEMIHPYGYVEGSEGADGDAVDVYVGPNDKSEWVYVIHQMSVPDFTEFDEDKCMIGFDSEDDAKEAYLAHYNDEKFYGGMSSMKMQEFKEKLDKQRASKITNEGKLREGPKKKSLKNSDLGRAFASLDDSELSQAKEFMSKYGNSTLLNFLKEIVRFTMGKGVVHESGNDVSAEIIPTLLDNTDARNEIFNKPAKNLYRGIRAKNLLGKTGQQITLPSKNIVSSWTADPWVAAEFANIHSEYGISPSAAHGFGYVFKLIDEPDILFSSRRDTVGWFSKLLKNYIKGSSRKVWLESEDEYALLNKSPRVKIVVVEDLKKLHGKKRTMNDPDWLEKHQNAGTLPKEFNEARDMKEAESMFGDKSAPAGGDEKEKSRELEIDPTNPNDALGVIRQNSKKLIKRGNYDVSSAKALGKGTQGTAFELSGGVVLKVTKDKKEAEASNKVKGKNLKYVARIDDVFGFKGTGLYGIIIEKLSPLSSSEAKEFNEMLVFTGLPVWLKRAQSWDDAVEKAFAYVVKKKGGGDEQSAEGKKAVQQADKYMDALENTYNVKGSWEELKANGVSFSDYQADNLMKRGGEFVLIDIGLSEVSGGTEPDVLEQLVRESVNSLFF